MKAFLRGKILKHMKEYLHSGECQVSALAGHMNTLRAHYLVGVLIKHDDNLRHVVELIDNV